jgi:hypothetical protein
MHGGDEKVYVWSCQVQRLEISGSFKIGDFEEFELGSGN